MEIPSKGHTTREKILEKYKSCVLYMLAGSYKKGGYKLSPCILNKSVDWDVKHPYVNFFDSEFCLGNYPRSVSWDVLYTNYDDAKKRCDHLNKLYDKGFYRKPFMAVEMLEEHKGDLIKIQKKIRDGLRKYPNFQGVDFCDVNAGGIQIRGHHKKVSGYCYGDQITIKYDFSNRNEVATEFIKMWEAQDKPEVYKAFNKFLEDGRKYGWD